MFGLMESEPEPPIVVTLSADQFRYLLYDTKKGGRHNHYNWQELHEDSLSGEDGRIDVSIKIPDEDLESMDETYSAEDITAAELRLASIIDEELNLMRAERLFGD